MRLRFLSVFFCLLPLIFLQAQDLGINLFKAESFPQVQALQRGDPLFDQVSSDLSAYYKARARGSPLPRLVFLAYTAGKSDTLYSISARLNLPYSTLASLNRLSSPRTVMEGTKIFLPNLPGIFLIDGAKTQLELLLEERLKERRKDGVAIRIEFSQSSLDYTFFPSEDFSPQERLSFLGSLFQSPLKSYRLSSGFGPRKNPFSGQLIHHDGIDMAAPLGTTVYAAADGLIQELGFHGVYGNYLVIDHRNGYQSVYGHLKSFLVKKGQSVYSGDPIGNVGNTGQSTGAHLHFEIHYRGDARNPLPFIQ